MQPRTSAPSIASFHTDDFQPVEIDEGTILRKSNQEAENLQIKCRHQENEIIRLSQDHQKTLQAKDDEISRLKDRATKDRQHGAKRIRALETENTALKGGANAAPRPSENQPRSLDTISLETQVKRLEAEKKNWTQDQATLQAELKSQEKDLADVQRDVQTVKRQKNALHEAHDALRREVSDLKSDNRTLCSRFSEVVDEKNDAEQRCMILESEVTRLNDTCSAVNEEIARMTRLYAAGERSSDVSAKRTHNPANTTSYRDPQYTPMLHRDILNELPQNLDFVDRETKLNEINRRPRRKQMLGVRRSIDARHPHVQPLRYRPRIERRPERALPEGGMNQPYEREDGPSEDPTARELLRVEVPSGNGLYSSSARDDDESGDGLYVQESPIESYYASEESEDEAGENGDRETGLHSKTMRNGQLLPMLEQFLEAPTNPRPTVVDGRFGKLAFREGAKVRAVSFAAPSPFPFSCPHTCCLDLINLTGSPRKNEAEPTDVQSWSRCCRRATVAGRRIGMFCISA